MKILYQYNPAAGFRNYKIPFYQRIKYYLQDRVAS